MKRIWASWPLKAWKKAWGFIKRWKAFEVGSAYCIHQWRYRYGIRLICMNPFKKESEAEHIAEIPLFSGDTVFPSWGSFLTSTAAFFWSPFLGALLQRRGSCLLMQYSHCGSAPAPPPLAPLVPGYGPDAGPWMSQGLPGMMTAPMDHHHAWARQALLSNEQPGSVFLVKPTKMNPGTLKCFKLYTLISGFVYVFKCRFKHSYQDFLKNDIWAHSSQIMRSQ